MTRSNDTAAPPAEQRELTALQARDLVVERGSERVLDGVSLAVDRGERLLIRGASGAGKSTLFEVLALLSTPDAGEILVDGTDVASLSERERAKHRRLHVGVVFQDFQLVPDLTAWENAALPQDHTGEQDHDWLETLFDRLDIDDLAGQYPATLSGGEKQRVAIARALANRPAVVLADEPTGQLDPGTADTVLDLLIDQQTTTGAGLAVVSHDPRMRDRFPSVRQLVDGRLEEN